MFIFIVLPIFLVAVLTGVESWLLKVSFIGAVGLAWYFWGSASVAVAVAVILGIAIKNSLPKFS